MEFLSADVYTEEVQGRNGNIPTASTSTFAMAGYSPRGPEGRPFVHASFQEFVRRFGGLSNKSFNAYAAAAFYSNGGTNLIFVRELHSDATYASGAMSGGEFGYKASGRGVWANDAEITLSGNPNFYNRETAEFSKFNLTVEVIDPNTGLLQVVETYEGLDLVDEESADYITKVVNDESGSENISVLKLSGGVPAVMQPIVHNGLALATGDGVDTSFAANYASQAVIGEETVKIKVNGVEVGVDDGQGNIIGVTGGPTVSGLVNYETGDINVSIAPAPINGASITVDLIQKGEQEVVVVLSGGSDGSQVLASDVVGQSLQATKRGIYALDDIDAQFQLSLPDFCGDKATDSALISYAETRQDVVVILGTPKGQSAQQAANYKRNVLRSVSSYGAMYWPWIKVPDSLNRNRPKLIPPVGHVAGRYAFTDQNENVGKAPAGVNRGQLSYLIGLEREVSKSDRDIVSQAQVNPIRSDANVGTAIFGNKTLQIVGDFTDVNIRRLFIFLRRSQYAGLLDILFEDVGNATYGLIKARLDNFLEQLFLGNVIGSGVPDKSQAFKVIVDESNNPESVQVQKRIVIDEFIKPNLAAEYIHLRIERVFDASQI